MAGAALIVELVFSTLGLVPPQYDAAASKSNLRWLRVPCAVQHEQAQGRAYIARQGASHGWRRSYGGLSSQIAGDPAGRNYF